ncbi:HalOD1 output domain-containing protein [Halorarius litoreus]|uniref:HalOD1 output domain-containing protein n=1 Tax=Halorarius litoreus TaxID=2962676 RepID=UPI0020CFAC46|nr:HalOD1 output domain-containing protein [Halorarius litoreus]
MAEVTQTSAEFGDDYEVHVTADGTEPLSTHVAEAVARAEGVDVTELDEDLYDAIDGDALETLYRHTQRTGASWRLNFETAGWQVVVSSDGTVAID